MFEELNSAEKYRRVVGWGGVGWGGVGGEGGSDKKKIKMGI